MRGINSAFLNKIMQCIWTFVRRFKCLINYGTNVLAWRQYLLTSFQILPHSVNFLKLNYSPNTSVYSHYEAGLIKWKRARCSFLILSFIRSLNAAFFVVSSLFVVNVQSLSFSCSSSPASCTPTSTDLPQASPQTCLRPLALFLGVSRGHLLHHIVVIEVNAVFVVVLILFFLFLFLFLFFLLTVNLKSSRPSVSSK